MGVFKRGKYWHVKFRFKNRTYTKSSRSILKRDALDLERQMRQKLIDTKILGRREHITLYAACDALLNISKESGAYGTLVTATKRFKGYFSDIHLDNISNRDLCCWVEHERQRDIQDGTIRLWSMQFNKVCRHAKRLGYYTPVYEWPEWHIKDKPIRYLTDDEEHRILSELDTLQIKYSMQRRSRQAARDIFILMIDAGFRVGEACALRWENVDFDNGVIYVYRPKVSNDDFIPMTNRLLFTLQDRRKRIDGEYVFPGRYEGHKSVKKNCALTAAFRRAGLTDISPHCLRKTFATRLLSRGAAITDVQHLLGHASVKTTERTYAAFIRNERYKQTIELLDQPNQPMPKCVT
jgi:integrase